MTSRIKQALWVLNCKDVVEWKFDGIAFDAKTGGVVLIKISDRAIPKRVLNKLAGKKLNIVKIPRKAGWVVAH